MSVIHFLNVLEGDCNIIQHDSTRVSVIDVSNAYNDEDTAEEKAVKESEQRKIMLERTQVPSNKVDYQQKKAPDNPIEYLDTLNIKNIFRFIITHPDMDHLDGIIDLFSEFNIAHIWDTNNNKSIDLKSFGGGFNVEDWKFYLKIRDGEYTAAKRLALYSGQIDSYWNEDNIQVLSPTKDLVKDANESGDYNDSSYVLLYTPPKKGGGVWKILFAGDSHDKSWEHIIENYKDEVSNIDILFAPHHGRDSGRNYDFLKALTPSITLFGNASSQHLAYSSYPEIRITNNQAGYVVINISEERIDLYVKNYGFADDFCKNPKRKYATTYNSTFDAWHIGFLNP